MPGWLTLRKVRSYAFLAAIAAVVILVDRITKLYVERHFGVPYGPRQVLDHVLFLTVTRNSGAAFGLFQSFTLGFLAVSIVVLAGILIYYWRLPGGDWSARLGLSLVFGGALANAYDRLVKGSVVDFIQVPHWPIFNIADSCISIGVVVLVLGGLLRSGHARRA